MLRCVSAQHICSRQEQWFLHFYPQWHVGDCQLALHFDADDGINKVEVDGKQKMRKTSIVRSKVDRLGKSFVFYLAYLYYLGNSSKTDL